MKSMSAPLAVKPVQFVRSQTGGASPLAARLRQELRGDVLFDRASRGRYATDASIYQVTPLGVVVPRDQQDLLIALDIARDLGAPVLARGAGTSQCGQTVGEALVIDNSKWLNKVVEFDAQARTVTVEPGIVLDHLNAWLKPHGLWFPVDVSTGAQCTIGGMTGNNSCGSLARVRQHGPQRARHRCGAGRRQPVPFRLAARTGGRCARGGDAGRIAPYRHARAR